MRRCCAIARACGVLVALGCAFMAGSASGSNRDRLAEDGTIRHVTATGVRVLVRAEPGSGLVAIVAVVDPGEADRRAAAGVKEIVARSVFGAGANLSAEGVAREVYRSGGSVASVTSPDSIALRCLTTPNAFRDAVYLIGQALKNAAFDAETVRRAAAAADRDRAMAAQPLSIGAAVARAKLFVGHPYGVVQLPSDPNPRSLAVADLLRYYRTAFVPSGTTIAVVGDIEPRAAIQTVDNQMVDYDRRSGATRPPAGPSSDDHRMTGRDVERVTIRASTTAVVAACKAPGRASSDAAAVRVLAALLGEGKASRLFRAIRDVRGIGYVVGAETQLWRSGACSWRTSSVHRSAHNRTVARAPTAMFPGGYSGSSTA